MKCLSKSFFLSFSRILDGALSRACNIQREFVSALQVTHLPPVWDHLLPLRTGHCCMTTDLDLCSDSICRVSQTAENKMSINNLSTVFGPTLLKPAAKTQTSVVSVDLFYEGTRDVMMQTSILHYFLTLRAKGRDFGIKM